MLRKYFLDIKFFLFIDLSLLKQQKDTFDLLEIVLYNNFHW